MTRIPQRQLRNQVSAVLRRAEAGERFEITVSGRAVAELGPLSGARAPASPEALEEIFAESPVGESFAEDIRRMRDEDRAAARDPWAE
jgi:prevent-host-death family protein